MVNRNLFYEELNKLQSRKANMIQSALSARNNTIEAAMNQRSIVRPQTDTSDPSQNFIRDSRSSAPKGETEDTNGYMLDTKSMRTSLEHVQAVRQAAEASRRLAQQRQNQKQQTALDENGGTLLDEMNPMQRKKVAGIAIEEYNKQAQTAAYVMNATAQYPSMHAEYEKAAADYKKATEQYELAKKEYAKTADDEDAYKESEAYKEELRLAQTPIENASTVEELKHNLDIYNAKAEAAMTLLDSSHLLYDRKSYEQASQTYDMYAKLQTQTQQDYNNAVDKEIEAHEEEYLAQGYHAANFWDNTGLSVLRGYYESKYYKEMALEALGFENLSDYWAEKLEDDKFKFFSDNHADQALSGASGVVGQMGAELLSLETFLSTVAAVGFAVTAGNAGPGALLPEEVFTIPAALASGINYGMSVTGAQIEMGMAYVEMIEAGVDRDIAVLISLGVGTVNGILESLQLDDVFKAFKVLDKAGLDNTFTKKLTRYLLDQGVHIAKETGQEVAQEMVTIAGVNLGKAKSGLETDSIEDIGQRLKDTAVSSALTFGMLNVAGMSGRLMNTAITRESLGNLSARESRTVNKAVTEKYAEQLKQDGVSQEHIDTYVKQAEKNATSKEAADAHTSSVVEEMNQTQRAQAENDTTVSPRAFLHTDGAYNQNVIAKTKLTDVDMTKLIENKVAFTNEQISTMNKKQLRYALNALMPSFVEQTKNNKAFAEVPLLIEKAQKTSDIKGMRDYVKMMQAQVATIDETSNALITNVDGYQLRDEGDGGKIEVGVNNNGIESLGDISFEIVERSSAEKANKWWSEMKGYDQPPYRLSTDVSFIRLAQDSHFVRVYDDIHSKMKGGWFMFAEDIEGLTPKQIQNKYALQYEPRYIVDITLKKGAIIRFGYANGLYGYEGGGLQFDSIDTKIDTFYNERPLKGGNDVTN